MRAEPNARVTLNPKLVPIDRSEHFNRSICFDRFVSIGSFRSVRFDRFVSIDRSIGAFRSNGRCGRTPIGREMSTLARLPPRVRDVPAFALEDGDFIPRRFSGDDDDRTASAASSGSSVARALLVRRIEDDEDEPAHWYALACETFDEGDLETCAFALDACERASGGAYARDPRFELRRAHCALASGGEANEETLRAVDGTLSRLAEASSEEIPEHVKALITLDACEIEREWCRRSGKKVRETTRRTLAEATPTLDALLLPPKE